MCAILAPYIIIAVAGGATLIGAGYFFVGMIGIMRKHQPSSLEYM